MQANPDEAFLLLEDLADLVDRDVGDTPATGVGGAVDHFTHGTSSLSLSGEVPACLPIPTTTVGKGWGHGKPSPLWRQRTCTVLAKQQCEGQPFSHKPWFFYRFTKDANVDPTEVLKKGRILLVNPQMLKFVCPTCLL